MNEYVQSLIQEDVARSEEQKLEELLLAGVRSERGMKIGSDEWKKYREHLSQVRKDQQNQGA